MIHTDRAAPAAPSSLLALAEPARAWIELSSLFVCAPMLATAPRGDGHDVVVLPGFAFSDCSTDLLRRYIAALGYRVHGWALGRNLGQRTIGERGERLAALMDALSDGGRVKVSLVGHSLGGVMARQYALSNPEAVRQVICLGSPFVGDPGAVNAVVARLHERLTGDAKRPPPQSRPPSPMVPFTAIFSRSDGIVSPSDCTETASNLTENVEVVSSHCGLVANPAVFYVVADRLAQHEGQWRPLRSFPMMRTSPQYDAA